MRKWVIRILVLVVVVVAGGAMWNAIGTAERLEARAVGVEQGPLALAVTATGRLAPTTEVLVGCEVSGTVQEILVDHNQIVRRGQPIARLKPELYRAEHEQAKSELAGAQARLQQLGVQEKEAKRELDRITPLHRTGVASEDEYSMRLAAYEAAQAGSSAGRATVQAAESRVSLAKYRLDRTLIVSPIDGVVLDRRVDAGQTVAATLMTPELFVLAEDLTRMQLLADVSEADVGYVCRGQAATFHVNAYREREFSGRVRQVRNQPRSTGSVVTYTVVIDVENPDGLLRPGMPADVSIELVRRESVTKIANAALRFRPPLPPDRIRGMLDELHWPPAPAPIRVATEAAGALPDEIAFVPPPIEPVKATLWRLVEQRWVAVPIWTAFTDNRETAVAGLDAGDGEFVVEVRKAKSSESALQKAIMLARPEDRRSWLSRSDK